MRRSVTPTWRTVLRDLPRERDQATIALRDALETADFARIWLAEAQFAVDEWEVRHRDEL